MDSFQHVVGWGASPNCILCVSRYMRFVGGLDEVRLDNAPLLRQLFRSFARDRMAITNIGWRLLFHSTCAVAALCSPHLGPDRRDLMRTSCRAQKGCEYMGMEQRALKSNINSDSENGRPSKPNLISVLLASVIIAALTGCGLIGVASGFSAQKAAIGSWSCEPIGKKNGDGNEIVIVDVRNNHTFTVTVSLSSPYGTGNNFNTNGTWRVFDGNLTLVQSVEDLSAKVIYRVPGFSKLGTGSTKFTIDQGDSKYSPRIKVISASRFEITGSEAGSEPWRCEKA